MRIKIYDKRGISLGGRSCPAGSVQDIQDSLAEMAVRRGWATACPVETRQDSEPTDTNADVEAPEAKKEKRRKHA